MKFIQIVTGQWQAGESLQHTIYGLTAEGDVYKWMKHEGWIVMSPVKKSTNFAHKFERPNPDSDAYSDPF